MPEASNHINWASVNEPLLVDSTSRAIPIRYIILYRCTSDVWPPGGPVLRANIHVAGPIGNRVISTESAFSACFGSGRSHDND